MTINKIIDLEEMYTFEFTTEESQILEKINIIDTNAGFWNNPIVVDEETPEEALNILVTRTNHAVIKARYLTADNRYHGIPIRYYIDVDSDTLFSLGDSDSYGQQDGDWPKELAQELGAQHPRRVLQVLIEQEASLCDYQFTKEEELSDFLLDVSNEQETVNLYKIIRGIGGISGSDYYIEYYLAYDVEDIQKTPLVIEKYVSRWQGSSDYDLKLLKDKEIKELQSTRVIEEDLELEA